MDDQAHPEETESLCPVCFDRTKAKRVTEGDEVFMVKECRRHGPFKTLLWRGAPTMAEWQRPKAAVHPDLCYAAVERGCPFDCGLCATHEQLPCSVVLEVTERCNLRCAVCFADAGGKQPVDPSTDKITQLLERAMAVAGPCNLQLSGGEPTLREDLPEIVEIARRTGYSFIQVNTNGLRLAVDKDYGRQLREAGLSTVFLQFDGVDDDIYLSLRGRRLLAQKLQAIKTCEDVGLGVILVPTLVRGVNTDSMGTIVGKAIQLAPVVRGVHFQPVSYFGRFPENNGDEGRFTLPDLMRSLEEQTEGLVKVIDFSPPGTEHSHCSFHATYTMTAQRGLKPVGGQRKGGCCFTAIGTGGVKSTVETISSLWSMPSPAPSSNPAPSAEATSCCNASSADESRFEGLLDLDTFLEQIAARSFTITAMAFQDAENIDLERLKGCCISVISPDGRLIPFCAYNLTSREGKRLYRPDGSHSR